MQFDRANAPSDDPTDPLTIDHLSHRYLWNPAAVDQLMADEHVTTPNTPGSILWPLADHLGTIRDFAAYDSATDATTVVNHRTFDAYGNLQSQTTTAVECLFAFTGRPLDTLTSLQNNLHRWYDAATGRWMSEDPIGFEGRDGNLYAYVGNGPANAVDPSGLTIVFTQGSAHDRIKFLSTLLYLMRHGGDVGRALALHVASPFSRPVNIELGPDRNPEALGWRPASTVQHFGRLNTLGPVHLPPEYAGGEDPDFAVLMATPAKGSAVVLAHELGHAAIGLVDPIVDRYMARNQLGNPFPVINPFRPYGGNVTLVENAVRKALGLPIRQFYWHQGHATPVPTEETMKRTQLGRQEIRKFSVFMNRTTKSVEAIYDAGAALEGYPATIELHLEQLLTRAIDELPRLPDIPV